MYGLSVRKRLVTSIKNLERLKLQKVEKAATDLKKKIRQARTLKKDVVPVVWTNTTGQNETGGRRCQEVTEQQPHRPCGLHCDSPGPSIGPRCGGRPIVLPTPESWRPRRAIIPALGVTVTVSSDCRDRRESVCQHGQGRCYVT
ncbi:hypothetical protein J6590_037941 [Homalodisca vitripennis]|nr:hypothetical protein J6590_037941 [Homalodisca vitripennis]